MISETPTNIQILVCLSSQQRYAQEPNVDTAQVPMDDEWINKRWYIHSEYSPLKRKEILTSAKTWMNHEDVVLGEISQLQKDTFFV